jgi:hypothetical protein
MLSKLKKVRFFVDSKRFKIQYKTIVSEENVEAAILVYTLSIVERKVRK